MNKVILIIVAGATFIAGYVAANPLPECEIQEVRAFPPQIGVFFNTDLDISGNLIITSMGTAVVDSGITGLFGQYLILDSTNTSGFAMNSEGDSIEFWAIDHEYIIDLMMFGNCLYPPPPIKGHSIILVPVWQGYVWSFDFSVPAWSETDVVINEINAHGRWGDNSDFIELFNGSDSVISLAGWRVVCDTIYDLPSDAVILPQGFFAIDHADFPSNFDLDFGADNIYLIDNNDRLVDQAGWSSDHGENVSFIRFPDGDAEYYMGYNDQSSADFEDGFPSRGAPNRHESPGFVVIGTRAVGGEGLADLYWTNPIWDDEFNGAKVMRSSDHFPEDPDDGQTVYVGTGQHFSDQGLPGEQWYYYTVFARNNGGEYSIPTDESRASIYIGSGVGIDEEPLPERISYLRAYPNPFNPTARIDYGLVEPGFITLSIYNILGQRIATISDGIQDAGGHSVIWEASDFPSGVYFARLEAGGRPETAKMALLK